MVFFEGTKKPGSAGLWNEEMKIDSGSSDATAPVHDLRLQLCLKGLDLAEHSKASG
jgi:hypothetical protein